MSKLGKVEKRIEDHVERAYKAVETGVVSGYKAVEKGVVSTAEKVGDKCVDALFTRDGETVEDAKSRMKTQAAEASAFSGSDDDAPKDEATEEKASEETRVKSEPEA